MRATTLEDPSTGIEEVLHVEVTFDSDTAHIRFRPVVGKKAGTMVLHIDKGLLRDPNEVDDGR